MPLTLYFDLLSQPARSAYTFLKVNKVDFELKEVDLQNGEQRLEPFKKVNPFGKVPVLDDSGFKLTESVAIVKYVKDVNRLPDHWYPSNAKQQARVEEFLRWYPDNTRKTCSDLVLEQVMYPRVTGNPPDPEKLETLRAKVTDMVGQLESYFLKDQKFIAGDKISIADLFGVNELVQLYSSHEQGLYEKSPAVNAWVERVKEETNPHFDVAFRKISQFHDTFTSSVQK